MNEGSLIIYLRNFLLFFIYTDNLDWQCTKVGFRLKFTHR